MSKKIEKVFKGIDALLDATNKMVARIKQNNTEKPAANKPAVKTAPNNFKPITPPSQQPEEFRNLPEKLKKDESLLKLKKDSELIRELDNIMNDLQKKFDDINKGKD